MRTIGRVWPDRWRPRPPVRMSRTREAEARGVWRAFWRRGRYGFRDGRTLVRRRGSSDIKAMIWCGVLKAFDYVYTSV